MSCRVTKKKSPSQPELPFGSPNPVTPSASIPLSARLGHEIQKPKDWQAFQRNSVLLFQAVLKDPNVMEYGRLGQEQRGIDILGRRDSRPEHFVGIQCRRTAKPLTEADILDDCRAALTLKADLKEIIFATTAPDDARATDAALVVERKLRSEGHDITIAVYGWGALQKLICIHDVAYAAFCPSIYATTALQAPAAQIAPNADLATEISNRVVEQLHRAGMTLAPRDVVTGRDDEDPDLHARIDTYRDLLRDQNEPLLAERGLLALLEKTDLEGKPWAKYRIETNLAAVALDLGREAEAAARHEAAYAVRPDDPNAIANLALARIIQGRFDEAIDLARKALEATPRADHAVSYLLQASERAGWKGDPESLIPADLLGTEYADLGLADFLRHREVPGWAQRCLELSRRYPDADAFKALRANAILALMIESNTYLAGGPAPVAREDLDRSADDLKAMAEHMLDIRYADHRDLTAFLNNAALILRISGRHAECAALLDRGLARIPNDPALRRLMALAQASLGKRTDAIHTLDAAIDDPENQLLRAELVAAGDLKSGLASLLAIDPARLSKHFSQVRWRLIGDMSLGLGDTENLNAAVAALRALDANDITATLLEIRGEQRAGLDGDGVRARLRAAVDTLPANLDMATRCLIAEDLQDQDVPDIAAGLLEGHVDLTRLSPATLIYLQSLAAARHDEAFRRHIAEAAPEVRNHPIVLWTVAAHAWNIGDLAGALRNIEALLSLRPDDPRARMLKIEILIRQDNSTALLNELDKPIEHLSGSRLQDRFRIANLLGHFGYIERAAALAYRLFLENRDNSQAWMALSAVVLVEGWGEPDRRRHWDTTVVAPNVAVNLRFDDGAKVFFVVEPDATLRQLDQESWEPDHSLAKAVMGLPAGGRFTDPSGKGGVVAKVRHKYVARFHYILNHHESRFPSMLGFRRINVDLEKPGGLDALLFQLKSRRDWIEQEQEQYRNGPWPLGVLAHRLSMDTIEVAGGLAAQGIKLKVARGNEPERLAAEQAIKENGGKGCVLDLLAFWTAWRLQCLDVIVAICGPIHLSQSVIDRLRARREEFNRSAVDGLKSATYVDGKMRLTEVAPDVVAGWRDDVDRAIAWANTNAAIQPSVIGDRIPATLREHVQSEKSDLFDCIVLAINGEMLLVTDDLPTREFNRIFGGGGSTWLHQIVFTALLTRRIDLDTYIRWFVQLMGASHDYIGVTSQALARAVEMDAESGKAPGEFFTTLAKAIGGKNADSQSHVAICQAFLRQLWSDEGALSYRQQATSILLRQLTRERFDDYGTILRSLAGAVRDIPLLIDYVFRWCRGHFMWQSVVAPDRSQFDS
jgi:tetratricopeptide (TPR) repeat protein